MRRNWDAKSFGPDGYKKHGTWKVAPCQSCLICPFHIIYSFNNSHATNAAARVNCGQNMAKKLKIQHGLAEKEKAAKGLL